MIATAGGAGLIPRIPGTAGSLVALPICYAIADWSLGGKLALWLAFTVVGTWAAKVFDQASGSSDNQKIVIDEVIGMGITTLFAGHDFRILFIGFVLFRAFDIWKPFPIRQIDRWSKKKAKEGNGELSAYYGGFGVIADDILAGIEALIVVIIIQQFLK